MPLHAPAVAVRHSPRRDVGQLGSEATRPPQQHAGVARPGEPTAAAMGAVGEGPVRSDVREAKPRRLVRRLEPGASSRTRSRLVGPRP